LSMPKTVPKTTNRDKIDDFTAPNFGKTFGSRD
jgi:hypothetical protein